MTQRRQWNSTLPAPTAPIARSPLRQTGTPKARKAIRPKKQRTGAEERAKHEREYGPPGRADWVQAQPSVASGKGPCVNAHTKGDGASRKGHYTTIAPLTDHEHRGELHQWGQRTFETHYGIDLAACAAETERLWLAHLAESAA